jgi:hypothetical protein
MATLVTTKFLLYKKMFSRLYSDVLVLIPKSN